MKKLTIYLSFILWGSNCTYDHALRVHTLQGMKNVWYVTVVSFTRAQIGGSHVSLTSQVALVIKNLPANAGDVRDKISNSREEPLEEGMYFRLQSSCLENPMDRGAWQVTVHRAAQSWTWLKRQSSSSSRGYTLTQFCWRTLKQQINFTLAVPLLEIYPKEIIRQVN